MINIRLEDAGKYFANLQPKFREAAMRGLHSTALHAQQKIQTDFIYNTGWRYPPIDKKGYRASWNVRRRGWQVVIKSDAPHAGLIEYGRRPQDPRKIGRAMLANLEDWAKRHGFQDPKRAAWALARSINRRGLWAPQGLRIFEKAVLFMRADMVSEVKAEIAKERG